MKNNVIALFDFDGTITKRDSLLDFLLFTFGYYKVLKMGVYFLPSFIKYKFKIISNDSAKEILFSQIFGGMSQIKFKQICDTYSTERIVKIVRKNALKKIIWHQKNNHKVIVISASIDDWIKPWANIYNIDDVIGTKVEVEKETLTGRFASKNCYGEQKVKRFVEKYGNFENYYIYAYGDSNGDKELLEIANKKSYRVF